MKKLTLYLLLPAFLIASCGKDDGPDNPWGLPDATKDGNNTLGFLINGEPWVAEDNRLFGSDTRATYDEVGIGVDDQFYFNLIAYYFPSRVNPAPDSAISESFLLNFKPIYSEGELDFSQLDRKEARFRTKLLNIDNTHKIYRLDTMSNNYLNITNLDTVKNIISGEFNFLIIDEDDITDTLEITEGRFDIKYQPD